MRKVMLSTILCIMLFSCDSGKTIFKKGKVIPGYVFNNIPNTVQTNGYIYGVNKSNRDILYLTTITMPSVEGAVTLPSNTKLTKTDFSTFLKWLGNTTPNIDASGNVKLTSTITMSLDFKDATLIETPVLDATTAIQNAVDRIRNELKKIVNVDGYDFYIIVSTIKAKKLDYTFEKVVADDINFKANVENIAEASPQLKIGKTKTTKLEFDDANYKNVLYKSLPLLVNHSLTGDYEIKLQTIN